jgi:hypothetical protein
MRRVNHSVVLRNVDTHGRIDADESGAHHQMLTALDTML